MSLVGSYYTVVRRSFILLLLPLYLATICRTALPFLDYAINYQYIVTELCVNKNQPALQCHGRCHLQNNIKQQEEREQRDGSRERCPAADWSCCLTSNPDIVPVVHKDRTDMYSYTQTTLFRAVVPPFSPPRA